MVKTILLVIHTIVCLSLILIVILQSGRSAGISGEIAGGAETFFGKNKARTLNGMLGRWTTYAAVIFVITSLALTLFWNLPAAESENLPVTEGNAVVDETQGSSAPNIIVPDAAIPNTDVPATVTPDVVAQ